VGIEKEDNIDTVQYQELTLENSFLASDRIDAEFYSPRPLRLLAHLQEQPYTELGTISTIRNGFPWNSDSFQDNGISGEPVVRIRDCKPFYIENKHLTTIESAYANSVLFEKAKSNDIVIGMDGLKWFYASLVTESVFVNQRVCHLTINADNIPPEYVTLVINSKIGQTQLLREMTIAQTVGHITNQSVSRLIIPLLAKDKIDDLARMLQDSMASKIRSELFLSIAKRAVELAIETSVSINKPPWVIDLRC
jgi:type I restriction enzyme, S subunit